MIRSALPSPSMSRRNLASRYAADPHCTELEARYRLDEVSQYHVPVVARQTVRSALPSPSMSPTIGTSPSPWLPHCFCPDAA